MDEEVSNGVPKEECDKLLKECTEENEVLETSLKEKRRKVNDIISAPNPEQLELQLTEENENNVRLKAELAALSAGKENITNSENNEACEKSAEHLNAEIKFFLVSLMSYI